MENKLCFHPGILLGILFFSTSCALINKGSKTVMDIDGNIYTTVMIGEQEWMVENLKTTRYIDGTPIPNVTDVTEWRHIDASAYVWQNNDSSNKDTYGALYNWWSVGSRSDLCPAGWRVASEDDWQTLESFAGMTHDQIQGTAMRGTNEGGKLKEAGTQNWINPNEGATNEFGFTVVPGGRRESDGVFLGLTSGGTIWTSTETSFSSAYYRHFATGSSQIGRNPNGEKKFGLAVRCIRNK
jgi:uncharacterized protein (TIGR02145 family)